MSGNRQEESRTLNPHLRHCQAPLAFAQAPFTVGSTSSGATVDATAHPDIMRVIEPAEGVASVPLERFAAAARGGNRLEIDMLLAQQVSSYVPSPEVAPKIGVD